MENKITVTVDDLKWLITNIQAEGMLVAQSVNGNPIQMLDSMLTEDEWVKEFMEMKRKEEMKS